MEPDSAAEQLQVIRNFMERAALYRRALAPIMLFLGLLGIAATVAGIKLNYHIMPRFGELWLGTALVGVIGSLLISRRQALKQNEAFWSPPTRCVAQAVLPPLLAGLIAGVVGTYIGSGQEYRLVFLWVLLYGCALHSAGAYMPRGIRVFAWYYIVCSCLLIAAFTGIPESTVQNMNWFMGVFFGVFQLFYAIRLFVTERGTNAT